MQAAYMRFFLGSEWYADFKSSTAVNLRRLQSTMCLKTAVSVLVPVRNLSRLPANVYVCRIDDEMAALILSAHGMTAHLACRTQTRVGRRSLISGSKTAVLESERLYSTCIHFAIEH